MYTIQNFKNISIILYFMMVLHNQRIDYEVFSWITLYFYLFIVFRLSTIIL